MSSNLGQTYGRCAIAEVGMQTHRFNRYLIYVLHSLSPDFAPCSLSIKMRAAYGCTAMHVSLHVRVAYHSTMKAE